MRLAVLIYENVGAFKIAMDDRRLGYFMEVGEAPRAPDGNRDTILPCDDLLVEKVPQRPLWHELKHSQLLIGLVAHAHDAHEVGMPQTSQHSDLRVELAITLQGPTLKRSPFRGQH